MKRRPVIRFDFEDGPERIEAAEALAQLLQEAARRFCSDDPAHHVRGRNELRKFAEAAVDGRMVKIRALTASKRERGGNPMRARIVEVMKAHKKGEGALKPLLEAWTANPMQGLRLSLAKDDYIFEDEEGELGHKSYKLSTLTTMFSKG